MNCRGTANDQDSVLIYLYPLGYAPNKLMANLNAMKEVVDPTLNFSSIVAIGATVKEGNEKILIKLMN